MPRSSIAIGRGKGNVLIRREFLSWVGKILLVTIQGPETSSYHELFFDPLADKFLFIICPMDDSDLGIP